MTISQELCPVSAASEAATIADSAAAAAEAEAEKGAAAEAASEALRDLFACGVCGDLLFEPTTLSCCGRSFCRGCLRTWIRTNVLSAGVPRCPGGCGEKVPFRLPRVSASLQTAMEKLVPEAVEQRAREEAEDQAEAAEQVAGHTAQLEGFKPWQDVCTAYPILFGGRVGVPIGTPGVLIGPHTDYKHVIVKFDHREDGSDLCVHVLAKALIHPLPSGFRLGQQVVTKFDLMKSETEVGVRFGAVGTILGIAPQKEGEQPEGTERLLVRFVGGPEDKVGLTFAVGPSDFTPYRTLVGSYHLAAKVFAASDLIVSDKVAVPCGTRGIVQSEYSATRLTVAFDLPERPPMEEQQAPRQRLFNVTPTEIRPWSEPTKELPEGQRVQAVMDFPSQDGTVLVRSGARGVVVSGVAAAPAGVDAQADVVLARFAAADAADAPAECDGEEVAAAPALQCIAEVSLNMVEKLDY